jgi:hypothetical protein
MELSIQRGCWTQTSYSILGDEQFAKDAVKYCEDLNAFLELDVV